MEVAVSARYLTPLEPVAETKGPLPGVIAVTGADINVVGDVPIAFAEIGASAHANDCVPVVRFG